MPRQRLRWWIHLVLIGAFPLAVGLAGWQRARSHFPALSHNAPGLLRVCFFELAIFGVVFGLAWLASRASRQDLLLPWRGGFWALPLSIAYSVALRLAVAFAAAVVGTALILSRLISLEGLRQFLFANRPDIEALINIPALRHDPLYFWLMMTLVSFIVAGFREELWRCSFLAGMRALWPQNFGTQVGQLGAVAIGAVIFGLGHLAMGPLAVLPTTLLGFGLGAILVLHRSIWPAVLAHGFFDATTFLLIVLFPRLIEQAEQLQ